MRIELNKHRLSDLLMGWKYIPEGLIRALHNLDYLPSTDPLPVVLGKVPAKWEGNWDPVIPTRFQQGQPTNWARSIYLLGADGLQVVIATIYLRPIYRPTPEDLKRAAPRDYMASAFPELDQAAKLCETLGLRNNDVLRFPALSSALSAKGAPLFKEPKE